MHVGLYQGLRGAVYVLARLLYRIEIVGRVPPGACVVAANHESLLDPPLLALITRRPLHFLAKVELWRYPPGAWLMDALGGIPIRRDRRDLLSVGRAEELLREGESVAIFPQGTVAGGAWTRGAARLALTTGVPIVPVRIVGTARALSHRRIRFSKIRIVVGEPIQVVAARPTVSASRELTRELQARVDALDVALAALRTLCRMPRGRGRAFDLMEPPERPADPAVRRAYLKRIVALFKPYRRRLSGVLALIIFSSALGVIPALLLREVIDDALPNGDTRLLEVARRGHGRDRNRDRCTGCGPDAAFEPGRPARDARPADGRLQASAAALARLLHAHAHG